MKPLLNKISPIFSGTEMIIPINIISDSIHLATYNSHISPESFLINSLLAFNIYKFDRYRDAQEDFENSKKIKLYSGILENKNSIEFLLFSSSASILTLLVYLHLNSIIPIYFSSFLYKNIKKIDVPIKPFYVSSLWTISTCIIPEYTNPNLIACMSVFLCIFSLTNIADMADYEEDIKYNVSSLPTKLGQEKTLNISIISGILSLLLLTQLEYFPNILSIQ